MGIHNALYRELKEWFGLPPRLAIDCYRDALANANAWRNNPRRGRRLVRYLWKKSREIARHQVDLEMSNGILVPRINSVSLWLVDDHIWKPVNPTKININSFENTFFTSVAVNTHRGWVHLDLEPSKEFYKLLARGFKPASHAKIKLDRRNRRVIFHLSLEKEVEIYKPEDIKTVDVNENSVATLYEAFTAILETDLAKTTLGYSYRKENTQRRNGSCSGEAR